MTTRLPRPYEILAPHSVIKRASASSRKCRSCELWCKKSRENELKQQRINDIENPLLKGCTTTGVPNYDQNSSADLEAALNRIPYVLEDFWHATYPPTYVTTDIRELRSSMEKAGVSYTKLFM
ncbi:hypothetical protein TNCV_4950631 [Trichonephila clavipes]|nr:hypothetical protein TNCV_4950631 [Trichonephila clavipes]